MYDTVILILKKEDIGDKYKWQAILQNIYQTCEYKKVEGGCGYTGGLRVSVTDKRIRIEGSLSKYYYGNNIRSLTLEHTMLLRWILQKILKLKILPNYIYPKCSLWGHPTLTSGKVRLISL